MTVYEYSRKTGKPNISSNTYTMKIIPKEKQEYDDRCEMLDRKRLKISHKNYLKARHKAYNDFMDSLGKKERL